ncbi:MAG: sigma-54 factor interaction domain-containing protein, partial [Spongiibacteraceae bacterium]|nr:sigma-54 factor interaction domain-containing protein [Spongiibacteraceae bacterium]
MPVEYTSTPIIKNNIIQGAVIIFRDISERKDHERSQKQAYKKIKQLKEELELERDYLRNEINITTNFGEIIGQSPALQRTLAQIEAVADTPSNVLILGESGVGKEMIARAIHSKSRRSDAPLVKVNCASIPKELFESEFFGHIRGSFTGAHRDRIGRLQLANGGTLFLDEIGEIPLALQSKLLRAIQEQEFERVGD